MVREKRKSRDRVFRKTALGRIRGVHRLSAQYNKRVGKPHQERLFELIRHHVEEIELLAQRRNPHFLVETGDLAVLCLEVLLEHRVSPDAVLSKCFGRYERKLNTLLREVYAESKLSKERLNKKRRNGDAGRKKRIF